MSDLLSEMGYVKTFPNPPTAEIKGKRKSRINLSSHTKLGHITTKLYY